MSRNRVIVRLKGGLGNQMFQYAAAVALSRQQGRILVVDEHSGFVRDKTYKRQYSLNYFQLNHRSAILSDQLPFYFEDVIDKYVKRTWKPVIRNRPWGTCIREQASTIYPSLLHHRETGNIWIDGYWQSETYFEHHTDFIADMYRIPTPSATQFLRLGDEIQENAVAVGVRLYEEAPENTHNYSPFRFIEKAAAALAKEVPDTVYYIFCTVRQPIENKLNLPGRMIYVTHDDGFKGEIERLWLMSQFRTYIISHSSFYWWAAWIAERQFRDVRVHAHNLFEHTIPSRWTRYA